MQHIRDTLILLRPTHWIKNAVVLLPVVFGRQMSDPYAWLAALCAAVAFSLAASCCYIINDIRDAESDRLHPAKRNRPIAAGLVSVGNARLLSLGLCLAALLTAGVMSLPVLVCLAAYMLLQAAYTHWLKHKAIADVICIAMGFVLRAVCGALAIHVAVSPWLFICMFTLCLFMGFCKRYSEIVTLADAETARNHRLTLLAYTPDLLTHLITVSAGIAVMAFLMYGLNERTVAQFGSSYFVYTLPVVIYGVFRFAMLSMSGRYKDPTDLIVHDVPFQMTVAVWMALILLVIRYGPWLRESLSGVR